MIIEGPVIDAGPQASVFLAHEEEDRGSQRGGRADESLLESLIDVVALRSGMDKGCTRPLGSVAPGSRSITQSHGR